jgi:hypothetical protein
MTNKLLHSKENKDGRKKGANGKKITSFFISLSSYFFG